VKRVLIGGIGNILLGDDGIGPYVVRCLEAAYEFEEGVEVIDLGTPALDLIYKIVDLDLLILIDAVKNGETAGTVACYTKSDLVRHAPSTRMDPHSPALAESLLAVEMLGSGPREVLLIAVTGKCYETSCALSETVRASVEEVIRQILTKLDGLGVHYTTRRATPDIWWAPACAASLLS
jgi:hydrogenase maturation protease